MERFSQLKAVAAPLDMLNVDTDMIIPKQFLKTISKTGLGKHLFDEMRYDVEGNEIKNFILNQAAYRQAKILIVEDNFGCGSSREHAPWALLDFGIKSIIAPSFADIFYNNCFQNGILPIILPHEQVRFLMSLAKGDEFLIDLPAQTIGLPDQSIISFKIKPHRKKVLLEGLDDVAQTLSHLDKIEAFEAKWDKKPYS